jgi:peptidoglycan/xylan/chitin deacetylase (PgdA/CDA1 family)
MNVKDRLDWDAIVRSASLPIPDAQVWRLFHRAVAGLNVALCMHHVSRNHREELAMPARELDAFIENARPANRSDRWLTVTFDDGYDDACYYIETRARRFPDVEMLLFVCPTKAERGAGFRWDLQHEDQSPRDVRGENHRPELVSAARLRDCNLASVEHCRRLRLLENVDVGNHTNCHFRANELARAGVEEELERSCADFERLFGPQRHFAFPFGMPGTDFDESHVDLLRSLGSFLVWTTARRPYLPEHRFPGAVLPRFPVDGRASATQLAFWIAIVSLRARARGLTPIFPARPLVAPASGPRVVAEAVARRHG